MSTLRSVPCLALLYLVGLGAAKPTTNITIYRLTPINYTGVTNMDTGDAAGDVMFGLNQLLLPQLCPQDPSFTWCANQQYLSGGSAHMVYTEFVVESDVRFGEYNACNPDPNTGIFECETYSSNAGIPRECAAGFDFEHEDCLNGTVASSELFDASHAEAQCCAACTSAGAACSGWNLGNVTADGQRLCSVLSGKLTEIPGAQSTGCKAAYSSPGSYACWYTDPAYNTSFAGLCDPQECACAAVSNRSVGRQQHAMCWNRTAALHSGLQQHYSRWFEYVGALACLMDGVWYSTRASGQCPGDVVDDSCWWRLAETHHTVNATCVDDRVVSSVRGRDPGCWAGCPQPSNTSSACFLECLFGTMLGNSTQSGLSKQQMEQPFVDAFKSEADGGCPALLCSKDADCQAHGDSEGYCKTNGWCRCSDGFNGQFCHRI